MMGWIVRATDEYDYEVVPEERGQGGMITFSDEVYPTEADAFRAVARAVDEEVKLLLAGVQRLREATIWRSV
jgi:hypothetical protein